MKPLNPPMDIRDKMVRVVLNLQDAEALPPCKIKFRKPINPLTGDYLTSENGIKFELSYFKNCFHLFRFTESADSHLFKIREDCIEDQQLYDSLAHVMSCFPDHWAE